MPNHISLNITKICDFTAEKCEGGCLSTEENADAGLGALEVAAFTISITALAIKCSYLLARRLWRGPSQEEGHREPLLPVQSNNPPTATKKKVLRVLKSADRHLPTGAAIGLTAGIASACLRANLTPQLCADASEYCNRLCWEFSEVIMDSVIINIG